MTSVPALLHRSRSGRPVSVAFPTLVRPQPVGRLPINSLLQHLHELSRVRELTVIRRVRNDRDKSQTVVSAGSLLDIKVDIFGTHMVTDSLSSDRIRSVLTQEIRPVMQYLPRRPLVGDKAYDEFPATDRTWT